MGQNFKSKKWIDLRVSMSRVGWSENPALLIGSNIYWVNVSRIIADIELTIVYLLQENFTVKDLDQHYMESILNQPDFKYTLDKYRDDWIMFEHLFGPISSHTFQNQKKSMHYNYEMVHSVKRQNAKMPLRLTNLVTTKRKKVIQQTNTILHKKKCQAYLLQSLNLYVSSSSCFLCLAESMF